MADTLNLKDLANKLAEKTGITKKAAYEGLTETFATIGGTALANGRVTIFDFGTFKLNVRKERTGRNPSTGEKIKIAEKRTVVFKAAPALKVSGDKKKAAPKKAAPKAAAKKPKK